jgi:transposase
MALWGAAFTAPRVAGAAVSKWDATGAGLEYTAFYFRDAPLLIDDYKQGVITENQFKKFVHNYSEGTGRTRGTKTRTLDTIMPARAIAISTGEDTPGNGDSGITARITFLPITAATHARKGDVDAAALAELQAAGAAGHLVAFWRGFVQAIAGTLDKHGADGLQALLQQRIAEDDDTLPGHKRAAGALRQNRLGFLTLTTWLHKAGYISADEREALDKAHVQARVNLAAQQAAQQQQNSPATIFLDLIDSLQQQGYIIEEKERRCPDCGGPLHRELTGWHCGNEALVIGDSSRGVCHYRLPLDRVIGFYTSSGQIGLNAEHCWALVQEIRRKQQQPLRFSLLAVQQQLDADGLIARKDGKGYRVKARNPALDGEQQHCLLLHAAALDTGDTPGDEGSGGAGEPAPAPVPAPQPDYAAMSPMQRAMLVDSQQPAECTDMYRHVPNEEQEVGTCDSAAESPIIDYVPNVPNVPTTNTYIYSDSSQLGYEKQSPIYASTPGTVGTVGTKGDLPQQEAEKDVPTNPAQVGTCETKSVHAAPQPADERSGPATPAPARPGADNGSGDPRQVDERGSQADNPAAPDKPESPAAAPQASQADELRPQPGPAILDTFYSIGSRAEACKLLLAAYGETPEDDTTEIEICRRILELARQHNQQGKPAVVNVLARLRLLRNRERGAA